MRRAVFLSIMMLGACGAEQQTSETSVSTADVELMAPPPGTPAAPAAPPPVQGRTAGAPPAVSRPQGPQADGPGASAPMLAYTYSWTIRTPARQVTALAGRHEQACAAAGPQLCQVVSAEASSVGADQVTAQLSFRAAPAYVQRFRAGLAREVEGVRGEITDSGVASEDLTRSITDSEAALRSGRLLQSRLEQLIASRPGNLQQLLEIERELARVRGEIDALQSNLEVMRARVRMSTVNMSYASHAAAVSDQTLNPLADAGESFFGNIASSLAVMLQILSLLLPWLLLLGAGLIGWRYWRRRRPAKAKPQPKGLAEG